MLICDLVDARYHRKHWVFLRLPPPFTIQTSEGLVVCSLHLPGNAGERFFSHARRSVHSARLKTAPVSRRR